MTAQLLYIMKQARPDIDTAIAFLCTRVKEPLLDNWKKLKQVLTYLMVTTDEIRHLGATDLHTLHNWIDASYAVHEDMRSHTGGTMSLGVGMLKIYETKVE